MKIQDIGGSFLWEERKGNTIGQKDTGCRGTVLGTL